MLEKFSKKKKNVKYLKKTDSDMGEGVAIYVVLANDIKPIAEGKKRAETFLKKKYGNNPSVTIRIK